MQLAGALVRKVLIQSVKDRDWESIFRNSQMCWQAMRPRGHAKKHVYPRNFHYMWNHKHSNLLTLQEWCRI